MSRKTIDQRYTRKTGKEPRLLGGDASGASCSPFLIPHPPSVYSQSWFRPFAKAEIDKTRETKGHVLSSIHESYFREKMHNLPASRRESKFTVAPSSSPLRALSLIKLNCCDQEKLPPEKGVRRAKANKPKKREKQPNSPQAAS